MICDFALKVSGGGPGWTSPLKRAASIRPVLVASLLSIEARLLSAPRWQNHMPSLLFEGTFCLPFVMAVFEMLT